MGHALIVSARFGPVAGEGGSRVYLRALARGLIGIGERVTVVAGMELSVKRQRAVDAMAPYYVFRHKKLPVRNTLDEHRAYAYQFLAPRVRSADYVLLNRMDRATLPAVLDLCQQYGVPFAILLHSRANLTAPLFVDKNDRDRAFREATTVLTVSDHLTELVRGHEGVQNTGTLINGINLAEIDHFRANKQTQQVRKVLKHFDERPTILTVGRLTTWKGQDRIIQAMPNILNDVEAHYLIAGPDEANGLHQGLVSELGLERSVTFLGTLNDREKYTAYEACDVFAMPSSSEGNPLVYSEARGFIKPIVVSTMVEGGARAVDHGVDGVRVDRDDVEDIAYYITRLLTDREYAYRLGNAGRSRVDGRSWQAVAREFLTCIGRQKC